MIERKNELLVDKERVVRARLEHFRRGVFWREIECTFM